MLCFWDCIVEWEQLVLGIVPFMPRMVVLLLFAVGLGYRHLISNAENEF